MALVSAASSLWVERGGGFTWRDMQQCVKAEWRPAVRQYAKDMERAGELLPVGEARQAHAHRPMTLFAPAQAAREASGTRLLDDLMRRWPAARTEEG